MTACTVSRCWPGGSAVVKPCKPACKRRSRIRCQQGAHPCQPPLHPPDPRMSVSTTKRPSASRMRPMATPATMRLRGTPAARAAAQGGVTGSVAAACTRVHLEAWLPVWQLAPGRRFPTMQSSDDGSQGVGAGRQSAVQDGRWMMVVSNACVHVHSVCVSECGRGNQGVRAPAPWGASPPPYDKPAPPVGLIWAHLHSSRSSAAKSRIAPRQGWAPGERKGRGGGRRGRGLKGKSGGKERERSGRAAPLVADSGRV